MQVASETYALPEYHLEPRDAPNNSENPSFALLILIGGDMHTVDTILATTIQSLFKYTIFIS
jgi:hypothetical protein